MQEKIKKLIDWYLKSVSKPVSLNLPCQNDELEYLASIFKVELPSDFITLYKFANGQVDSNFGPLCFRWLTVADIINSKFTDDFEYEFPELEINFPTDCIKPVMYNSKWIPFLHDGCNYYIAVDLDPDTKGKYGQIINCGGREWKRYVIAESLQEFIMLLLNRIEKEEYKIKVNSNGREEVYFNNRDKADDLSSLAYVYGIGI